MGVSRFAQSRFKINFQPILYAGAGPDIFAVSYSRYKKVEAQILEDRPTRGGRVMPVEASDFVAKSALFLPKEARYDYLVNLPEDVKTEEIKDKDGNILNSLGAVVNNAMLLIEDQSQQLIGVLPKNYTDFSDEILAELLRIFNNGVIDEIGGDIIGRIYEYFLNKFAKTIASDDGVFFTPKSLVKTIVNIIEPKSGVLLEIIIPKWIQEIGKIKKCAFKDAWGVKRIGLGTLF